MGRITQEALDALREAADTAREELELRRVRDALSLLRTVRRQESERIRQEQSR